MQIEKVSVTKLNPAKYNPRKELKAGDKEYEKLKRSIVEFGYVEPIIWNKTTGNVVGGHQRLTVLKDLGHETVDCVVVELDETKEKALNIALNKIQGEWDDDKLASLLTDIDANSFDVTLTGFDLTEVDELLNEFYSSEAIEDDFDYEEAEEEVKTNKKEDKALVHEGEIWQLGNHRLVCADPTSEEQISKFLAGKKAQCTITCPPECGSKEYEVNGVDNWLQKVKKAIGIASKHSEMAVITMHDLYNTGTQFIEPTTSELTREFVENDMRPIWMRIWKKNANKTNGSRYHLNTNKPIPQYEYIGAFSKSQQDDYNDQEYEWISAFAKHSYKFARRLSKEERKKWGYAGIWEMTAVKTFSEGQTAQPIELPWRVIKMHTDKHDVVYEPFGGTGTTLLACEQTDRDCYLVEENPDLCEVIIRRWEEFTGNKAVKLC